MKDKTPVDRIVEIGDKEPVPMTMDLVWCFIRTLCNAVGGLQDEAMERREEKKRQVEAVALSAGWADMGKRTHLDGSWLSGVALMIGMLNSCGISQTQISKGTGINDASLSRWKKGKGRPKRKTTIPLVALTITAMNEHFKGLTDAMAPSMFDSHAQKEIAKGVHESAVEMARAVTDMATHSRLNERRAAGLTMKDEPVRPIEMLSEYDDGDKTP